MKKEEVMDYVMNTPGNTNPNVLGPMLGALEGDKLPNITAQDAGKVLTALTVTEKGAVIVPEQSVEITETQKAFDNADASLFTDGAKIIVTVGESEYEAVIEEGKVELLQHIPVITIRKSGNSLLYYLDDGNAPVNAYISVNLASISGVWGAQMPMHDVLYVEVDNNNNTSHSATEVKNAFEAGNTVYAAIKRYQIQGKYETTLYQFIKYDDLNDYAIFIGLNYSQGSLELKVINNNKKWSSQTVDNYGDLLYRLLPGIVTLTFVSDYSGTMSLRNTDITGNYRTSGVIFIATINGETKWSSQVSLKYISGYSYPRIEADFGDYIVVCEESATIQNTFTLVPKDNRFIVTLTPTALDYSGTMDKTVAEINAAYKAGQEIVFRTMMSETDHMDVDGTARWYTGTTYPSFNGFIFDDAHDICIVAFTGATDDGTRQTYRTEIYTLANASGALVVTDTNGTLDKTWQEIHDAMLVGYVVIDDGTNSLCAIGAVMDVRAGEYKVATCGLSGTALRAYTTDSASGYPHL